MSRIHVAAIDGDGLAGYEVAVGRCEKNEGPEKALRRLTPPQRARCDGALARGLYVARILDNNGVAQRKPRRQRIDPYPMLAKLARQRPGEGHDAALAGDIVQHPGNAAIGGARADIDDLAVTLRLHVRGDVLHHKEWAAQIDCHHLIPELSINSGALRLLQRRK